MATAYLAAMQGPGGFNKLMVVKRLRPALATEPEFLRMFLQEARLAARIDHPNVVHTSEVGFDGEDYFIAMEYIEGQSLENVSRRVLSRAAGLSVPPPSSLSPASTSLARVAGVAGVIGATPTATSGVNVVGAMIPLPIHLSILVQVLAGLDFAHELKDFDGNALHVVHRDVSPHNVMVTYEGHVKLVDFGIAKAADSNGDTRTGVMKGKCAYMPAEQFGGKVDRRADVFAVGVMLWQALTGRRLWKGLSDAEVFQRLTRDDIPRPSSVKEDVSPALEAICLKALSFAPSDRYDTAADFQAALEDVVAGDRLLFASPRETGKYVAELFAADREKVRAVIEEELGSRAANANNLAAGASQTLPQLAGNVTGSIPAFSDGARSVPVSATSPSTQVLDTTVDRRRPRTGRILALTLTGGLALGVLAFAAARTQRAPAARVEPVAPVSAEPATPALVQRTELRVTPAEARVTVDGEALAGGQGTRERDGKRHLVQATADGYAPRSEWLVFDREIVEVTLDRADGEAAKSASKVAHGNWQKAKPEAASAKPEAAPTPPPVPSKKGMGLDTGDPWAK